MVIHKLFLFGYYILRANFPFFTDFSHLFEKHYLFKWAHFVDKTSPKHPLLFLHSEIALCFGTHLNERVLGINNLKIKLPRAPCERRHHSRDLPAHLSPLRLGSRSQPLKLCAVARRLAINWENKPYAKRRPVELATCLIMNFYFACSSPQKRK